MAHKNCYSISFKLRYIDFWLFEDIILTKGGTEHSRNLSGYMLGLPMFTWGTCEYTCIEHTTFPATCLQPQLHSYQSGPQQVPWFTPHASRPSSFPNLSEWTVADRGRRENGIIWVDLMKMYGIGAAHWPSPSHNFVRSGEFCCALIWQRWRQHNR